MQIYLVDIGSSYNSCVSTTTLRRTPELFYAQAYIHISALHFMTSTKVEVTGSFSPFIKVTTGICVTDNSTVVFTISKCAEKTKLSITS